MELPGLQPDSGFAKLFKKRVAENQDLAVLVSDHQNRRGTGKTVLSLKLASILDQTEEGITTEKVSISVDSLIDAYTELSPGSALVLDEAEAGLSKYEAGTAVNKAMRELVSMGRIEQKYLILNCPSGGAVDRDLKALCDFWWLVQQKGLAKGHFLHWNPYRDQPRTPRERTLEWSDIEQGTQLREVYDYLTEQKRKHLRGESEESSQRLTASEVQNQIDKAKSSAETEVRNDLLTQVYQNSALTQKELADSVGLSRSRLADIVTS